MKPTISWGMRTRRVNEHDVLFWVNFEAAPIMRQMRQAQNFISRQQAKFQSNALATFQTLWTSDDIAVNSAVRIDAQIIAFESGNVGAFTLIACFYNDGTTAQEGVTTTLYNNNPSGYAVQYAVVGNHVELQGRDAGSTVNWTAVVDVQEQVGP